MPDIASYSETTQLVALCRYGGVSPRLFDLLFTRFGSLQSILEASVSDLNSIEQFDAQMIRQVREASERLDDAREYCQSLSDRDIQIVTHREQTYPHLFEELNDPPPLLYVRGGLPDPLRRSVALVGASKVTSPGIELTSELARRFVEADVQVVSSLHGGIDSGAHLATHSAGGKSFAVVDRGFDHLSDPAMAPLAIDIAGNGGLISEYPPEHDFYENCIKESNRLIVGLVNGVVITEVYTDSSRTLDLLQFCNDIGKLAFLVFEREKGPMPDEQSLEKALRCGAIPMEGLDKVSDIIASLV